MDLLASIRKEGSRGGRGDFTWTQVQSSQHRENYLGHSVMAPVGRWQQGRDLQWYTKEKGSDDLDSAERVRYERQQEIRKIQDAEREALNSALGSQTGQTSTLFVNNTASHRGVVAYAQFVEGNKSDRDYSKRASPPKDRGRDHKRGESHHRRQHHHHHHHKTTRHEPKEDECRSKGSRKRRRSRSPRSRSSRSHRHKRLDQHRQVPQGRPNRNDRSETPL